MACKKVVRGGLVAAALSVGLSAVLSTEAQAGEWEFVLNGIFNGTTSGATPPTDTLNAGPGGANILTANDPFTLTAVFNSSNVVFQAFQGFNAYAPNWVTLKVGGQTYNVATYTQDPGAGFTVALFDKTSVFGGDPGKPDNHVAAGFLAEPVLDGAGIITDFTDGSPADYSVYGLTNIVWPSSNYFGVGFGSGPCPPPGPDPLTGACQPPGTPNTVVPIPLDGGTYDLTLGVYDLNNPSNGIPDNPNSYLFSASLTAVPEPSTWALFVVGFIALASVSLRIGRRAPLLG
jgi:hypothetical protein